MATTTTVQTIIDNVLNELGIVSSNSVTALSTTNLTRYVNSAHKELLNHPDCLWDFMMRTYAFDIKADTTVATAITAGAVSIVLTETATWPSTGRVIIEGEEFNYTANAADTLTVPACQASHPVGAEVTLCYAIPSTMRKPEELWIKESSTTVGRGVRYNYQDFRYFDTLRFSSRRAQTFRTSRIDTYGAFSNQVNNFFCHDGYLYLPYHTDTRYGILKYSKEATRLTSTSSILDIPDHEERLFEYIYETLLARGYKVLKRYDRTKEHMALADRIKMEITSEHAQKTDKVHARAIRTYW